MSFYFGQIESFKRKLHDLQNDLNICFLSCNGLHYRKDCFGNLFGKHFGADGTWQTFRIFSIFSSVLGAEKGRRSPRRKGGGCPKDPSVLFLVRSPIP